MKQRLGNMRVFPFQCKVCGTTLWFTGWEEQISVVLVALWKQRKSEIDPIYEKPDHVLDGRE